MSNDNYTPAPVPNVFVEPLQPVPPEPAEPPRKRGAMAVVAVLLFGALAASTLGLVVLRNADQAEWSELRKRLETERADAFGRAGRLEAANATLRSDLEAMQAKIEKYGAIEYQLNLIRQKTDQIEDLRKAKPSYPHQAYMTLTATPDWSVPGEKLLKDFVARLDVERQKLIAFREPQDPQGPTTPSITPAPTP